MKMIDDMPEHEDLKVGDFVGYNDTSGKEHGIVIEKLEKGTISYRPVIKVFWIEASAVMPYSPPYFLFSRLSK